MSQLVESILLKNGTFPLLPWHQARFDNSRRILFPNSDWINLESELDHTQASPQDITKCRLIYDSEITKIEYLPYQIKPIRSLQVMHCEDIDYSHKWVDRSTLDRLYQERQEADDILIVKNGLVTDSYYANVAFLKNGVWYTPSHPLLSGVRRQFLLRNKQIVPAKITIQSLIQFDRIRLFNAMIAWQVAPELSISDIYG